MTELVDVAVECNESEPYQLHQSVAEFMEQRGSRARDYLFCLDPLTENTLIIRSRRFSPHEGRVVPQVETGQSVRFVLRAVVLRRDNRGPRKPIRDQQGQLDWLNTQGLRHGFIVNRATASGGPRQMIRKGQPSLRNDVVYVGQLSITDDTKFMAALESGIGREKAFGFGLMQIVAGS